MDGKKQYTEEQLKALAAINRAALFVKGCFYGLVAGLLWSIADNVALIAGAIDGNQAW